GLDLAGLQALLTVNTVSRFLGAPLVPFDLVVVSTTAPPIPEPSTWAMATLSLGGLLALCWRGRQRTIAARVEC
ncbi:MAG: PEP-CTERM sorting domain-containing protein, partial [Planctomycetota bacterium]